MCTNERFPVRSIDVTWEEHVEINTALVHVTIETRTSPVCLKVILNVDSRFIHVK
jgi:hypothetical protein